MRKRPRPLGVAPAGHHVRALQRHRYAYASPAERALCFVVMWMARGSQLWDVLECIKVAKVSLVVQRFMASSVRFRAIRIPANRPERAIRAVLRSPLFGALQQLHAPGWRNIRDEHVTHLRALTLLDVRNNPDITDAWVSSLTTLTSLDVGGTRSCITDVSIAALPHLARLSIANNAHITDASVCRCTGLTDLDASGFGMRVTDVTIAQLGRSLTTLVASHNRAITDAGVAMATRLRRLRCQGNPHITDRSVSNLTRLVLLCGDTGRFGTRILAASVVRGQQERRGQKVADFNAAVEEVALRLEQESANACLLPSPYDNL